jgi:hypothetical protein
VIAIIPGPTYVLARAAWIPTVVIWHADGRFTRLDGCAYGSSGGRRLIMRDYVTLTGPTGGAIAAGGG